MHFPHFHSLVAALVLLGIVTAAPVPQEDGISIVYGLLDVGIAVDSEPL